MGGDGCGCLWGNNGEWVGVSETPRLRRWIRMAAHLGSPVGFMSFRGQAGL
jgi:hypothetical protein